MNPGTKTTPQRRCQRHAPPPQPAATDNSAGWMADPCTATGQARRQGLPCWPGLLAMATVLAGCAAPPAPTGISALPRYIAPAPGQPAARLLLRAAVSPTDRFAVVRHEDALLCQRPQVVSEGSAQQPAPAVQIAAGALTTLDFVVLRPNNQNCGVSLSFTPAAGRSYLVLGLTVGANCDARLMDASQPDRPVQPSDLVRRSEGGQRCVPLAQAKAPGTSAAGNSLQGGQHNGEAVLNPRATTKDLEGLIR